MSIALVAKLAALVIAGAGVTFLGVLESSLPAIIGAAGAIIAAIISTHNSRKIKENSEKIDHVKRVITAPRRMVYNEDNKPIGTILDLDPKDDWEKWLKGQVAGVGRRKDDPTPNYTLEDD